MMNSSRCRPGVLSIADEMIEWRYALLVSPKMALFGSAAMSTLRLPAQPVDATQALNLSAGVSNCKISRGRSFS
jgi:hypothetical protein